MTAVSYLISVSTSQYNVEVNQAIVDIAGEVQLFYGESNDSGSTNLWIIPQSKKGRQELITQLQELEVVRSVSVIPLSKPVTEPELTEVRELFATIDWDTSEVSDEELSLFMNARLQNDYTYYMDFDWKKKRQGPVKLHIRLLQEHPQFSPEWLKKTDHTKDREFSSSDIEITRTETFVHTVVFEAPPAPPAPPHNLQHMTDEQIQDWVRNEKAFDHLKDGIIEIKRTSKEIMITIAQGDETMTIGYSI